MVYLITYDLNKAGQNYDELYKAIKDLPGSWWHFLDSAWIIQTNLSSSQIFDSIKHTIDANDGMLIIKVTSDHAGWLPQGAWDWLSKANY